MHEASSLVGGGAESVGRGGAVLLVASVAFVLLAVTLEVVAGEAGSAAAPAWAAGVFPVSWPQPVRVVWWLTVSVAALGFRVILRRLGLARHRLVTVGIVAPFVVFAGGIALGADWATWH